MSPVQSMILDFEKKYWHRAGDKEAAIRDTFDMSPMRYYQLLGTLIDEPEALAAEPVLVNRLRRLRDSRARVRRAS
ncbi:DUF3263 domain-containing protein [Antrihabitans sp. NCIMB 15449]|uniref:DUF3263 domain-containing protein n=1 Tax=Antrihabitans spumae TaxID=3373370 RepID=A0ABW7JMJ1_9NOCA